MALEAKRDRRQARMMGEARPWVELQAQLGVDVMDNDSRSDLQLIQTWLSPH